MRAEALLDLERIDARLKAALPGLTGRPTVTRLGGGASNLTFALDYPERSLVLRRPPPGRKAKGAHDMIREARIIEGLRPQFPLVPEVYLQVDDPAVMDTPFFVMERLEGPILRGDGEAVAALDEARAGAVCETFVRTWVALHGVDVGREELAWLDRGSGYVARQIGGWTKRYRDARTPDAADFEAVIAWLDAQQPEDAGRCLIHNDYRLDNVVLDPVDPTRFRGVLDWELATVGCPLMDLGASLAYWVQADDDPGFRRLRLQPTDRPGMWTRTELIERYLALAGRHVEEQALRFYVVYGLFRLAGIAQQIYYRHYHGQFEDDRFSGFGPMVHELARRCLLLL